MAWFGTVIALWLVLDLNKSGVEIPNERIRGTRSLFWQPRGRPVKIPVKIRIWVSPSIHLGAFF